MQGCCVFDWPLIPRWPLCHTSLRNAGCPGPETGSLGVKKRLGGWGNHIAGRDSLSVCLYVFTICTCPFRVPPSPPRPSPEGTIPASVSTCKPGPPCSLCPGSFRPPGNANCQRRCFTGSGRCVRWGFLSSSVARSPSHFWKTLTAHSRIQDRRTNTSLSQNHFMNSVWAMDSFDLFSLALDQNYRNE